MHIEEDSVSKMKTKAKRKSGKAKKDMTAHLALLENAAYDRSLDNVIIFNTEMRKTFVKGVLQDAKGYFESKTDGKVEVEYEEFSLKNHEFSFRICLSKGKGCTKQMFNEVSGAFINVMGYMFQGEFDQYDIGFSTTSSKTEAEIVSNW